MHLASDANLRVFAYLDAVPEDEATRFIRYCERELGVEVSAVGDADLSSRARQALDRIHQVLPSRPRAQNARFVLPDLLDGLCSRAVYMDVDVIIVGDISPLWELDLGDCAVGAVQEPGVGIADRLPEVDRYFNSGVMLLDVDRWIRGEIGYEVVDRMIENSPWTTFDQDSINLVLAGPDGSPRWQQLPPEWNAITPFFYRAPDRLLEQLPPDDELKVIHYAGGNYPGRLGTHPYGNAFMQHLEAVPFKPLEANWQGRSRSRPRYLGLLQPIIGRLQRLKVRRRAGRRPDTITPGPRRSH